MTAKEFLWIASTLIPAAVLFAMIVVSAEEDESGETWNLHSCPLELILQDGSRYAKPDWSLPGCRAVIGWRVKETR